MCNPNAPNKKDRPMSKAKTTTSAFLDALRQPDAKIERPKMSMSARINLRKLMAVVKAEIAANAATMTPVEKKRVTELAKALEASIFML